MKTLALTGGIASGKSTVAQLFEKYGARVIHADLLAHQTYRRGTPLYRKILNRYGKKVLARNGQIDRQALGKILFDSKKEKQWLEKEIHPLTRKLIGEKIQQCLKKKIPLILVEAALHVESGYYQEFQGLIVVKATKKNQIERLTQREGLSKREALARIQNQMPLSKKIKCADWVIDNSGTLKKTEKQVKQLIRGDL